MELFNYVEILYFFSSLLRETRRGTTASLLQTFAVYTCGETHRFSPPQPLSKEHVLLPPAHGKAIQPQNAAAGEDDNFCQSFL